MFLRQYFPLNFFHFLLVFPLFLVGCSSLPKNNLKTPSYALSPAEAGDTNLGKKLAKITPQQLDKSGFFVLSNPEDAFAARMQLIDLAEKTLDLQYYIWRLDATGKLMIQQVFAAAERGVRVRILLDDNGIAGLDNILAQLNQHPNIEVRIFNPFKQRKVKWLNYVTDFSHANRRMHNKSFIVDNQVVIIGGRNISNEYFGAPANLLYADLDVLAVGNSLPEFSSEFDLYWSSEPSYPLEHLVQSNAEQDDLAKMFAENQADLAINNLQKTLQTNDLIASLFTGKTELEWASYKIVSDDPIKGMGLLDTKDWVEAQISKVIGKPQDNIFLVTPYFVPSTEGTLMLTQLAKQGIKITILTNSLEATDVSAVHSGYAKRRKKLLKAGVELYEMKRFYAPADGLNKFPKVIGDSAASLHAKTFTIDGQQVFIGSFNFDQRSEIYNTELGVIIDSPKLAQQIEQEFTRNLATIAYKVELNERGKVFWKTLENGQEKHYRTEPNASWGKRFQLIFFSFLPIDSLL